MTEQCETRKIAIIGGGPSGLCAAYFLRNKGLDLEVIESSPRLGGLAQSFSLWGRPVELGAHFLEYESCQGVKTLIGELFEDHEIFPFFRETFILKENGQLFHYPPSPATLLFQFRPAQLWLAGSSYLLSKLKKTSRATARSALIGTFGRYLYQFFFHDFSIKLWDKPCSELDACYCQSMLPFRKEKRRLPLRRRPGHRVVYFKNGMENVWERVQEACAVQNVSFRMNSGVAYFKPAGSKITIGFQDGSEITYDQVISTLPASLNRTFFGLSARQSYLYRNLILVYLKVDHTHLLPGQAVYFYEKDVKALRVIDFSRFPQQQRQQAGSSNLLLLEYWTGPGELFDAPDADIMKTVNDDLRKLRQNFPAKEFRTQDFHIKKIPKAYRVPELGLPEKLKREQLGLNRPNFHSIGRSNSPYFNYGMDNAITEAFELSKQF